MALSPAGYSKPWADWLAGRIHDPVTRLRFLQAVAPPVEVAARPGVARFALPALLAVLLAWLCIVQTGGRARPLSKSVRYVAVAPVEINQSLSNVWLVENAGGFELYSNGLRVDHRSVVSNRPRAYLLFPRSGAAATSRSEPVGIVYHATESRLVPFEPDQNRALQQIGESLLDYVRRKRAYHFLIDRFGRVFRVVAEADAANHAGNSVWADDEFFYINLNQSFLGVSIEGQGGSGTGDAVMSPAQLRAAGMLTEMLRGRYQIRAENCITHAQVSVNPSNMQVGYHTDWAAGFPFEQIGLPDNYGRPLPALWAFGFDADPEFSERAGARLRIGVDAAEAVLAGAAMESAVSPREYRKSLQSRYREWLAEVRHNGSE